MPALFWDRLCALGVADSPSGRPIDSSLSMRNQKDLLLQYRSELLSEISSSSIHTDLEFRMGSAYCKIVEDCFDYADYEEETSIDNQQRIVSALSKLSQTL